MIQIASTSTPIRPAVRLFAGYPDRYPTVYHRTRMHCGDMTVFIDASRTGERNPEQATIIVRPIEKPRAKASGQAKRILSPEEIIPDDRRSPDRDTSFAQAAAEVLKRDGIREVVSDPMLPLLFVDMLFEAGIAVICNRENPQLERRMKDQWERAQLREAQKQTEAAIRFAYETIRAAPVDRVGVLQFNGSPLTSEILRAEISIFLLRHGFSNQNGSIVAPGRCGGDCHHRGEGPLHVDEPIIVDIFPMSLESFYWGDSTRTFVRGKVPPVIRDMHAAVTRAKEAAISVCRAGAAGRAVHRAAMNVLSDAGYHIGPPSSADDGASSDDLISCPHGTGHGVGLECHEPPILDDLGPELVDGDALTIEPGLYSYAAGGVRLEDMVIVTSSGCDNLNSLPTDLWWD